MNYQHLFKPKFWFCVPNLPATDSYPVTIETDPSKTNLIVLCL